MGLHPAQAVFELLVENETIISGRTCPVFSQPHPIRPAPLRLGRWRRRLYVTDEGRDPALLCFSRSYGRYCSLDPAISGGLRRLGPPSEPCGSWRQYVDSVEVEDWDAKQVPTGGFAGRGQWRLRVAARRLFGVQLLDMDCSRCYLMFLKKQFQWFG